MNQEIYEMSAIQLIEAYRSKTLTRREVVEAHLKRIDEINPHTNAVIHRFDERALREAEEADQRADERDGLLLDGVPVMVSDWYSVEGVPHSFGVKAWKDNISKADDAVVDRIRKAGAIILGKTSTPEFFIRWNSIGEQFGETRNGRDVARSAGGSGGGAAASVASGLVPIAFHADLGGSLRVPATFNNVITLRPSGDVVPLIYPLEPSLAWERFTSLGPFTRTMEDAWLALRAIAGPHPSVPKTVPLSLPASLPARDSSLRVARIVDETGVTITPEVRKEVDRVADILTDAGYEVVDVAPPRMDRLAQLWVEMLGTELMQCVMPDARGVIGDRARDHIDTLYGQYEYGSELRPFIEAEQELRSIAREVSEFMAEYPLILGPVTGMETPLIDYDYYLSEAETRELFDSMRSNVWVNALGLPGVALGNGAQIIGRDFHDTEVAVAAKQVLNVLGEKTVAQPTVLEK
jgi:amidase